MTTWTGAPASASHEVSSGGGPVEEGVTRMASRIRRYAALFLSSAVLACTAPVFAQTAEPVDQPVYLEADHLQELEGDSGYLARGNVRARQNDRTLFADELEYRPESDRVIARGNVIILRGGDFPQYADEIELDSAMSAGVALGFATMLENNGRMAAAAAIRRENGSMQFNDAYYTACELCADGEDQPTWRLRAREVVQDTDDEMIYYRDAQLEVMGVPVLYSPVFAHADPSSERRSGFLFPTFGVSSRLGAVYQQPYYWAISEHQDLTIAPRVMTNVNPLLYAEYRKRFWSGQMELEGSITHEYEIDSDGERFGDEEWRWHVMGGGEFDLNEEWVWGFGVQRASDELHIRRYDFSEQPPDRDEPLTAINRHLISQLYVEGRTPDSYAGIFAASYQSLLAVQDDTLPDVLPLVDYRRTIGLPDRLGRIALQGSGAALSRSVGTNYRRASASADWQTRLVSGNGIVLQPFAQARVDYYDLADIPGPGTTTYDDSFSREVGLAGAEISWPFYRAGENVDWIVEPVVSAVSASDDPVRNRVVNEDSLSLDLDESLLFEPVRAHGYDVWEEGQRVSYGLRTTAQWGDNRFAQVFVGQSTRLDGVAVFNPASGLFEENSDLILAGEVDFGDFEAEFSTRLDSEDYDLNRLSLKASYSAGRFRGSVRYLDVSDDAGTRAAQRELVTDVQVRLSEHWSLVSDTTHDLDQDLTRRQSTGFQYRDECSQLEIVYERQDLGIARLGPSEALRVRVTLFTLGSLEDD
jgi:LPS-assembly protein